jgi:hypothetical protein
MKKLYLIIVLALVLSACQGHRKTIKDNTANKTIPIVENEVTEVAETSADEIQTEEDYKVYKYEYKGSIHGYKVCGEIKKHNPKTDKYFTHTLIFTNIKTGKRFYINNGWWQHFPDKTDIEHIDTEYTPHHTDQMDIVTAPYEDFFFADIDFDGTDELIADARGSVTSQRGVNVFRKIYKIIEGNAIDYTEEFVSKFDKFGCIEQYFFTVNTNTKSIMFYSDGGINNWGWDMYDYRNEDYVYRNYVSIERDMQNNDIIQVSIYPNSDDRVKGQNLIKRFMTTQKEYDEHKWEY